MDDQEPERVPEEWEIEGPAVSISLGDAADLDPVLLAAITGPYGLGGQGLGPQFGQDHSADALRPGPVLAALTEQAVMNAAALTDDQLTGALQAARRLENRASWQQTIVTGELARRRQAQHHDAIARNVPRGRRPGEFPADELAAELLITCRQAEHRLINDLELTSRLPATLAGMAAGLISAARADLIACYAGSLTDTDAAHADQVLAAAAPGLRYDQLARKAAALEMKLNPEAVKARRELAKALRQRVEAGREDSGNAYLSGRELATADVLASKAHIDAVAARLRRAGLDGTLDQLRALALTDLTQGRDPLHRVTTAPRTDTADTAGTGTGTGTGTPGAGTPQGSRPVDSGPPMGSSSGPGSDPDPDTKADLDFDPDPDPGLAPPPPSGRPAPLPALINLIIPVGTLLGWSDAPAQAGSFGLLDPEDARDIAEAASRDPRTRWCTTFTGADGTAIAHGCAPGQHPWTPQNPGTPPPAPPSGTAPPGPQPPDSTVPPLPGSGSGAAPQALPAAQAARLRDLLCQLGITPEPIARGTCDHRHAEEHYSPSRKLRHLVRARAVTCTAPGCGAQAVHCDLDHVIPWPAGPTCECNTHPACRRHHRCKQAPGWRVEEPRPGVMRWTTPASRSHTTTPTVYDT